MCYKFSVVCYISRKQNSVNKNYFSAVCASAVWASAVCASAVCASAVYASEVCDSEVCDTEVCDIFLRFVTYSLGLPQDIYNLVNHNEHAKQIWDKVKLLIQGSELSLQERESKLYDDFDIFTSSPGESIHSYYMRFAQLINDMHTIGMTMQPLQVNIKFVNRLQPEQGKFVTDIKLAKDMHTTNFDHLYAHLRQHEAHANEVRLTRQRYPDQIALVDNSSSCLNPTQYYRQLSLATQQYYLPHAPQQIYDAPMVQQSQYQPQVVTHSPMVHQQPYQAPALQQSYQAPVIQKPSQPYFLELDSGLTVPSFNLF
ncbi:hypothetical protein Tco_1298874 [Tanacetum coccineum]